VEILAVNWRDIKNPDAGGAEVHLHEILRRIAERGHGVTLVCSNFDRGAESDNIDGIRIIRKGKWYNANYVIPFFIKKYLKDHKYDLIVEDINKIPFLLPAITDTKVLVIVPHLFGGAVFNETNAVFASYVYMFERFIPFVYQSCRFIAISPSTRDDLISRGIPSDRIDVVLCGLDHSLFKVLDGTQRFDDPTIVHFGRIRKYKRIDMVIRAFAMIKERFPTARLLIIGEGPYKQHLHVFAQSLGLNGSVEFTGAVSAAELVKILNRSHIFINASAKEGWGLTVVEANACGMPVIASNRPGLKDSLKDGVSGYLVEYGDVAGFAGRACELLGNEKLWQAMSSGALKTASFLTWEKTADEMEKLFLSEVNR